MGSRLRVAERSAHEARVAEMKARCASSPIKPSNYSSEPEQLARNAFIPLPHSAAPVRGPRRR